ncbi:helix-turn-helix transcriptional regulator [Shimia sp. R9_1]|uniref:helix-turn-helix domain-containing protein n=1 Tax=Shimia sp. R9_1 TaxID=2821111 RepID=UPI001ADA7B83|nr:helix-turn-helix transcriptional regulator [Shimia sp. R9_1]MBO9409593.1 helix-turn-helix transcriptional regulator [Shimia sp. R9_1]
MSSPNTDQLLAGFAQALKRLRKDRKLSQQELAQRAERSMQYISLLETCRYQPTLETLVLICSALDISLSDFASEIEREHKAIQEA